MFLVFKLAAKIIFAQPLNKAKQMKKFYTLLAFATTVLVAGAQTNPTKNDAHAYVIFIAPHDYCAFFRWQGLALRIFYLVSK